MIIVTPPKPEDTNFITATFLDSYMKEWGAGPCPYDIWHKTMTPAAEALLFGGGSVLLVARVKGEKNTKTNLLGWSCVRHPEGQPPIVVYAYVKGLFRKGGIARALLRAHGINYSTDTFVYSTSTNHSRRLGKKAPHANYNPLAIRENHAKKDRK